MYNLASNAYILSGGDAYTMFVDQPFLYPSGDTMDVVMTNDLVAAAPKPVRAGGSAAPLVLRAPGAQAPGDRPWRRSARAGREARMCCQPLHAIPRPTLPSSDYGSHPLTNTDHCARPDQGAPHHQLRRGVCGLRKHATLRPLLHGLNSVWTDDEGWGWGGPALRPSGHPPGELAAGRSPC